MVRIARRFIYKLEVVGFIRTDLIDADFGFCLQRRVRERGGDLFERERGRILTAWQAKDADAEQLFSGLFAHRTHISPQRFRARHIEDQHITGMNGEAIRHAVTARAIAVTTFARVL